MVDNKDHDFLMSINKLTGRDYIYNSLVSITQCYLGLVRSQKEIIWTCRIFTKYIFIKIKPRNIYYFLHTALQTTQFSTYYTCTYTKNTCSHIVISTAKVVNSKQVPII